MKKSAITLALAAALLLPAGASARNPQNRTCGAPCDTTVCTQASPTQCAATQAGPFDGIELTEAQRTALNNIKRPETREARREARRNYLNQVKGILTPEQYVAFLENLAVNNPGPRHAFNRQGQRDGNRRHNSSMHRRDNRPQQAAQNRR